MREWQAGAARDTAEPPRGPRERKRFAGSAQPWPATHMGLTLCVWKSRAAGGGWWAHENPYRRTRSVHDAYFACAPLLLRGRGGGGGATKANLGDEVGFGGLGGGALGGGGVRGLLEAAHRLGLAELAHVVAVALALGDEISTKN